MNFPDELIQWYFKNKRDLPWRNTTNAYVIWLSEIILQQTRVEQGLPYFHRFLEKYPDVRAFATADEGEILNLWQGLGYYSRGRNMLKTARQVVSEFGGEFPVKYEQLIHLKGIGEYTASAISSFSANEAKAVVDGNVFRVLARYFGISEPVDSHKGKKLFQEVANDILSKDNPGLHNQAIMEFGAMLCKPKNPDCAICPVRSGCYACTNNAISELPKKLKKSKIRERFLHYIVVTDGDTILMNKRDEKDIWANMYDFPLFESSHRLSAEQVLALPEFKSYFGENSQIIDIYPIKKHVLTHQHLYAQFIHVRDKPIKLEQKWFYTNVNFLKKFAMPKIIFIFINNLFNL
ncbi:MAG: A/G-specific adenine glycosylase [Mucilaginibacter sp.]|nr:A/G-specific adenine glycosylase [Mucilaginibacter sp.]